MALDLSSNPVRVVPSSVVSLERLETLDLSNTKLPEFPLSLTALPALRVLRYEQRAGTRLTALPDDFALCVRRAAASNKYMFTSFNRVFKMLNILQYSRMLGGSRSPCRVWGGGDQCLVLVRYAGCRCASSTCSTTR